MPDTGSPMHNRRTAPQLDGDARIAGLLVAIVPAAALPRAAPALDLRRTAGAGAAGAAGDWDVVVGEQVGGSQPGGEGIRGSEEREGGQHQDG